LLVVNAQLAGHPELEHVRQIQIECLCPEIEKFNHDFQLPIIVCGGFNSLPHSDVYHTMITGRKRPAPEPPLPPSKPLTSDPTCSSIALKWEHPISNVISS